jgi:hypothetical protein
MADWSRIFEDPIPLPGGSQLVTLLDAANTLTGFRRPTSSSMSGKRL